MGRLKRQSELSKKSKVKSKNGSPDKGGPFFYSIRPIFNFYTV